MGFWVYKTVAPTMVFGRKTMLIYPFQSQVFSLSLPPTPKASLSSFGEKGQTSDSFIEKR